MPKRQIIFLWIALLAFLSAACSSTTEELATPTPVPRPVVPTRPTYEVQRGDVTTQLQFVGRIRPVVEEQLFFRTDGRVRNVYVKQGDMVTVGQVLADLESVADLETQQALDEMNIQRAEIYLDIAKLNQQMAEAGEDSEARDIEVAIRENEVKLAQLSLDEILANVENRASMIESTRITSPIDGQVLTVSISPGNTVLAFGSGLSIADVSELEVSATLRLLDIENLTENMTAIISPVNRPGETIEGVIRSLPYQSTAAGEGDDTIRVELNRAPSEVGLELNDRVNVVITLETRENVLWLPPQAVRTFEGRRFVVVRDGDVEQRVDVKLGLQNDDRTEIEEGLTEGQIVVGS